jgi:hypothetical protein
MQISGGMRLEEKYLKNYYEILTCRAEWEKETECCTKNKHNVKVQPLLDGAVLQKENRLWGNGLLEGPVLGKVKNAIENLQSLGIIETREHALKVAASHIVLHHLSTDPVSYLESLQGLGWLGEVLPELDVLRSVEQKSLYHKEDAYVHTIAVLESLPENASTALRLAAIFHDIGKAVTQTFHRESDSFRFYGHDRASVNLFEGICDRFCWSDSCLDRSKICWLIENHIRVKLDWENVNNPHKTIKKMFFGTSSGMSAIPDSYREDLVLLWEADSLGASGRSVALVERENENRNLFRALLGEVTQMRIDDAAAAE